MRLTPRYGGDPLLRIEIATGDVAVPFVRQRARLRDLLASLDDDQWAHPSRCAGWSVQDVVAHLVGTNRFWAFSITSGRAGEPTRLLTDFDPVATPAQMVDAVRARRPGETLDELRASHDALAAAVAGLDDAGWATLAEAPPGHLEMRAVVLHALWDGWVHERDIALPLGLDPVEEPDEIVGSLLYAAALGPTLLASTGSTRTGELAIDATDPRIAFVVEAGPAVVVREGPAAPDAAVVTGSAVEVLEALSFRAPAQGIVPETGRWMVDGLGAAFDVVA